MRPSRDQYLMRLALVASERTTCIRRGVGCVLADSLGHVLAIGYNGNASGLPHCNHEQRVGTDYQPWGKPELGLTQPMRIVSAFPFACEGHNLPAGQDKCEAVHAEQNALLQCREPQAIAAAYVTLSPCLPCLKLLLNTPCQRIVFLEAHVNSDARALWQKAGRSWEAITI